MNNNVSLICPRCNNNSSFYRYGFDSRGYQKYLCRSCNRQFAPNNPNTIIGKLPSRKYQSCTVCGKATFLHHDFTYYSNLRCCDKSCNHSFKVSKAMPIDSCSSSNLTGKDHFKGLRFPVNIVLKAMHLYFIGKNSLRECAFLMKTLFNVSVSHTTIHSWVSGFAPAFKEISDYFKPYLDLNSDEWHLDETVVKVAGIKSYIWFVEDSETRFIVDFNLSTHRNSDSAFELINSAKEHGCPNSLVTDRYSAYLKPIEVYFPDQEHIRVESFHDDISNNLIESFHSQFKSWYKTKRGFESFEDANNIISMFVFYYNFIRPHSSLNDMTPAKVAGLDISEAEQHKYLIAA